MRTVHLDKIASVALNCRLQREVKVGDSYPCQEGDVLALRVLDDKETYNSIELTSGRMSPLARGDVIAGALGHRSATQGHAGHLPKNLTTGGTVQILNMGGVVGLCTSSSPIVGRAIDCEVVGQVLGFPYLAERVGVPENISRESSPTPCELSLNGIPVIAVLGTSMNSGKTEACLRLIQCLTHRRLKTAAGKATGVSLRRDILAMEDAGASPTAIFTDFGVVTTQTTNAALLAVSMLNKLAQSKPDVIVLELGDGLFGSYGVDSILGHPEVVSSFSSVVLAANDPVAAWGGVMVLRDEYGIIPKIVTGPATDNEVGISIVRSRTGVECINARTNPKRLADHIVSGMEALDA